MYRILLVEDDKSIVANLTEFLRKEGFLVEHTDGQTGALSRMEAQSYDLVLLDVSLRDGNGFGVCTAIKSSWQTPVIFLTAAGDEYSVVTGLDLGADDYIAKPFRPRELVSRMKSVLRRYSGTPQPLLEYGDLRIDTAKAVVTKQGRELFLSALEYRLLLYFFTNKGIVLSREKLLSEIWDIAGEFVNDNTLTVYIKRIREKIEDDPSRPELIKTIRGIGYKLG